ncbi:unnamed protein product [Chironomus riparius]|uniref:Uncharacterized protein n=1 Tax=Chironomus riparius TaxID=315576 RepID=A0A9N9S9R4_9DIPT|nr:unnamed protein product [Chironomus riparius]
MKCFILIIAAITAVTFSYPSSEDSYEYEDFSNKNWIDDSNDESYFQQFKNSKFVNQCIRFNSTIDPKSAVFKNQRTNLKEPTAEQKENCWNYLKNKGTKARKWFTSWFSTSQVKSDAVDDETTAEYEILTTSQPNSDNDDKIYFPDTFSTQKPTGLIERIFG